MSLPSILITVTLFLGAAYFVAQPILSPRQRKARAERPLSAKARRDEALLALRDLEFDYRLGKVTAEDYGALKARLVLQAAEAPQASGKLPGAQEDVEALVAARRGRRRQPPAEAGTRRFCHHCGGRLHAEDLFCPACGERVPQD